MKRFFIIGCLIVLLAGTAQFLWAQDENLSANRTWGAGVRFLPSALSPIAPYGADPALGTAIGLQYWVNDLVGLEAGGWASAFKDQWSENNNMLLSGGLLYKLANSSEFDFYLVGRGMSQTSRSKSTVYYEPPLPVEPKPESRIRISDIAWPCLRYESGGDSTAAPPAKPVNGLPPCPWPAYDSRSSTMAIEVAGGIEWSAAPQVAVNVEFGMVYSQMVTTNIPGPLPPPWPPDGPKPLQQAETFASSNIGWALHVGIYYYF